MKNVLRRLTRRLQQADDTMQTVTDVVNQLSEVKSNHLTTNQRLDLMDRRLETVEHFMDKLKKQLEEQS